MFDTINNILFSRNQMANLFRNPLPRFSSLKKTEKDKNSIKIKPYPITINKLLNC